MTFLSREGGRQDKVFLEAADTVTFNTCAVDLLRLCSEKGHREVLMDSSQRADTMTGLTFIFPAAARNLSL